MDNIVHAEIARLNAQPIYSDMETHFIGEIVSWAMSKFKSDEDITHEQMIKAYWKEVHNIS